MRADDLLTPPHNLASDMSSIFKIDGDDGGPFPPCAVDRSARSKRSGNGVGAKSLVASASLVLELRREQPNEDPQQHSPRVGRVVGRLQREHDPLGDHTPLGRGNAGCCLEQVDGLGGEPRPVDLEKVIEPVERRGKTVGQHAGYVATRAAILTTFRPVADRWPVLDTADI